MKMTMLSLVAGFSIALLATAAEPPENGLEDVQPIEEQFEEPVEVAPEPEDRFYVPRPLDDRELPPPDEFPDERLPDDFEDDFREDRRPDEFQEERREQIPRRETSRDSRGRETSRGRTPEPTQAAPDLPLAPAQGFPDADQNLRLNFRGVPLEMVLEHLSEAAGFIINMETKVTGRVDVWSNQPLSNDEAVALLDSVLKKNGYAAIRNGRILTIVDLEQARRHNLPVRTGSDPELIPRSDEMVTQIIPIRYITASQLTRDLQPLLSQHATLTANEGGNSLVLTDAQANIRRMVEIVRALDTSVSSFSDIRVFPLEYADAKALAAVVKELFEPEQTTAQRGRGGDPRAQFFNQFRGGGAPQGGEASRGAGGTTGSGRTPPTRVVAVADERSNSLVVSAPPEMMLNIQQLVYAIDTNIEDITEVRVFRLQHSDPTAMADVLSGLFPDTSREQNRGGARFGGPFGGFTGGGGGRGAAAANTQTDRTLRATRVLAVADRRTSSLVVSAGRDLMPQIAAMIEDLDSNPAGKQQVEVYSLENADAQNVEEILRGLFESGNNRNTRSTANQNNALNNRNQQNQRTGTGIQTGGFGTGGGGTGNRGGQTFR
jgi:type II secretory pathway component GspD/PulD (secretin)